MLQALCFSALAATAVFAAPAATDIPYVCWSLEDALDDLRSHHGLPLIWSSTLVRDDMRVTTLDSAMPGERVDQWINGMLEPFELALRATRDGASWLVVPKTGAVARALSSSDSKDLDALLPHWSDRAHLPERWTFPGKPGELALDAEALIVRVEGDPTQVFGDSIQAAFELKQWIVDAGSKAPNLQIALQGRPEVLESLVQEGLAPYIHAYVYDDLPFVPKADTAARTWHQSSVIDDSWVLSTLLAAADRGDQRVLFKALEIGREHQQFLHHVLATAAADLDVQPEIDGIERRRARFFVDPENGDYFLTIYAQDEGHELSFTLPGTQEILSLFPREEKLPMLRSGDQMRLVINGSQAYQLFQLKSIGPRAGYRDLEVASTRLVDPYEEVVKNQVFQRQQKEQFESLDVMEYLSSTPQYAGGSRITWEHRILQRKGKYSEYHHLGFTRNGVRSPENRLLKGRLFRTDSLIQFQPLEVELDETFSYRYLGQEDVDGHATYRIAFKPIPDVAVERKHRVSGEVWLDQKTHAHRKLRTYQEGLDAMIVFMDLTYHYEWIFDDGQCFWDWRLREGSLVGNSDGRQYASLSETRRKDFNYNRPDIDQVAQAAYDSDLMIHVEVPPEGHRWLVKQDGSRRFERRAKRWDNYPALGMKRQVSDQSVGDPHQDGHLHHGDAPEPRQAEAGTQDADPSDPGTSSRVLADIHSFGSNMGLSMAGYGSESSEDISLFPGIYLGHGDLFGRGYRGSISIFEDYGYLSFGNPSLFGSSISLSASLESDFDRVSDESGFFDPETDRHRNLDVRSLSSALRLALAGAINRRLTVSGAYVLRRLNFNPAASTDPDFVLPNDTDEHVIEAQLVHRSPKLQLTLGVESGSRQHWEPWGLFGEETLESSYNVISAKIESYHPLPKERMLGASLGYIKGWDLDRFSRKPGGRSRARLVGFADGFSFDEGAFANADLAMSLFKRFPIGFRVNAAQSRFDGEDWESRIGVSFRFLIHGPFKLNLWPSIRTGVYSSVGGETGKLSYGLVIRRSY